TSFFEGPRYGARAHDARARTAPKMGYAPEDLAAAAHEVSADVVKPRTQPGSSGLPSLVLPVLRQHGGAHLNVIQQWLLPVVAPPPVEVLECLRALRQSVAGREEEKECEQHRNVHRYRADRVTPQGKANL